MARRSYPVHFGLEGTTSLSAPSTGAWHEFIWNSLGDTGPLDLTLLFRITPTDALSMAAGTPAQTAPFSLWNTRAQTEAGAGTRPMGGVDATAVDGDEGLFFMMTLFVIPLLFLIAVVYTVIYKTVKHMREA